MKEYQKVKGMSCQTCLRPVNYCKPINYCNGERQYRFKRKIAINLSILEKIKKFWESHSDPTVFL